MVKSVPYPAWSRVSHTQHDHGVYIPSMTTEVYIPSMVGRLVHTQHGREASTHPGYTLPYTPWVYTVYTRPDPPCCITAVLHGLYGERALGSNLRFTLGERPFYASGLLRCDGCYGPRAQSAQCLTVNNVKDWIAYGSNPY